MNDREIQGEPPPLPAEAIAMLAAYRADEAMPRAARGRVWNAIADAPADAQVVSAPRAGRWGLWIGGGLAAAAVLLLAGHLVLGLGVSTRRTADPTPQAAADRAATPDSDGQAQVRRQAARAVQAPADEVPHTDSATLEREPPSQPVDEPDEGSGRDDGRASARPQPHERASGGEDVTPSDGPAGTSDLAAERELIAAAWRALARGSASQARAHAEAHAKRFPAGMLAPERAAVDAIATCREAGSPRPALAEAFERAHPRSPLASRVREACAPNIE